MAASLFVKAMDSLGASKMQKPESSKKEKDTTGIIDLDANDDTDDDQGEVVGKKRKKDDDDDVNGRGEKKKEKKEKKKEKIEYISLAETVKRYIECPPVGSKIAEDAKKIEALRNGSATTFALYYRCGDLANVGDVASDGLPLDGLSKRCEKTKMPEEYKTAKERCQSRVYSYGCGYSYETRLHYYDVERECRDSTTDTSWENTRAKKLSFETKVLLMAKQKKVHYPHKTFRWCVRGWHKYQYAEISWFKANAAYARHLKDFFTACRALEKTCREFCDASEATAIKEGKGKLQYLVVTTGLSGHF